MKDLENETTVMNAELERGDGVFDVARLIWTPFDIEADDERVEIVAVDAFGVGDPCVDEGRCVGDDGGDCVVVEGYVVEVVSVIGKFVVDDADRHC